MLKIITWNIACLPRFVNIFGNPLWFTPVILLSILVMIEGLHTTAHLHQEIDVHGICRQNKEYIESKEDSY